MNLVLTKLLVIYKKFVSFFIELLFGGGCRFQPTCSEYATQAINTHGSLKGTGMALKRLSRCHPWGGSGYDPVAPKTK